MDYLSGSGGAYVSFFDIFFEANEVWVIAALNPGGVKKVSETDFFAKIITFFDFKLLQFY